MKRAIRMHVDDNVATTMDDLGSGEAVSVVSTDQETIGIINVAQPIPFGHKLAILPIKQGEVVTKYGEVIGVASTYIAPGEHTHIHNVNSARY